MTSDKKNISLLTDIFVKSGLTDIVISPGSRNAPIIISFANRKEINAFTIVDERSAAFFALGLALNKRKTVAIACTSGSAVLNYASAISEAFYQKIPLLILTADRPPHLIDVGDGQTIRQENVFANYVKRSYNLPLELNSDEKFRQAEKDINEALLNCVFPEAGPVHINIPFDEPLYNLCEDEIEGKFFPGTSNLPEISDEKTHEIAGIWNENNKVMVIGGQSGPDPDLGPILNQIAGLDNTIILTETTSNLSGSEFIDTIDNVISGIKEANAEDFRPEMLISFGGQIVSKMIKKFLRNHKPSIHYHISTSGEEMNTYFCLTETIQSEVPVLFNRIFNSLKSIKSDYKELWMQRKKLVDAKRKEFIQLAEFSDLKVFDKILDELPGNSVLHLGNSTPVRYSQLFGSKQDIIYRSNRGVSGIDGQVSTAAAYAFYSDKLNVMISGDLGFLYDSNALMNHYLKPNFKIIIINNSGGGIFRFIPGPDSTPDLEQFFEARHEWDAYHHAMAFGLEYQKAESLEDLEKTFPGFFNLKNDKAAILEIFTPAEKNAEVLREYFRTMRG